MFDILPNISGLVIGAFVGFLVRAVWERKFPSRVILVDAAGKAVVTKFEAVKKMLGINSVSEVPVDTTTEIKTPKL